MITVVFLTHRYLDNYHFDKVLGKQDRLVCIMSETQVRQFPEDKKSHFDKIYMVSPLTSVNGPLTKLDYNSTKAALIQELNKHPHLKLICVDEGNMMLAATLRDEFNLGSPSLKELKPFRNKLTMKEKLVDTNVRIPKFASIDKQKLKTDAKAYFNELSQLYSGLFVLKPVLSAVSYGIHIISSWDGFSLFANSKYVISHEYEVEEFIKGHLYHCDIAIQDGKVIFEKCCQYSHPNNEFTKGRIIATLELLDDNPLKDKLLIFAKEVLKNLDAFDGTYHIEIFNDPDKGLVFLELAARPVGGAVAKMYEIETGTNLFDLDLSIHLQIKREWNDINKQYALQALVPMNPNTVSRFKKMKFQSHSKVYWLIDKESPIKSKNSVSIADISAKLLLISDNYKDIGTDFDALSKV